MPRRPPQAVLPVIRLGRGGTQGAILAAGLVLLGGCASSSRDPLAVVGDDRQPVARRIATLDQQLQQPDNAAATAAALRIAWARSEPLKLRLATIDALAVNHQSAFLPTAPRRLEQERDSVVVQRVFDHAADQGWPGFDLVALRRLATVAPGVALADRPELAYLAHTSGGRPPQDIAFEVFGGWDAQADLADRVAAWVVLGRLVDRPTRDALLGFARGTPAEQLQMAQPHVDVLPDTREQVVALMHLADPAHADLWQSVGQTPLAAEQRRGLALRHLPAVKLLRDQGRTPPARDALLAELDGQLDHEPLARRESRALDANYTEAFADHRDTMVYGDLLTLTLMLGGIEVVEAAAPVLFAVADLDRSDVSTELGGLMTIAPDGSFTFRSYDPMLRGNDTQYIASDELLADLPRALAHVHFHAQSHRNPDHAGPGRGDLAFARRFGVACVVLTFLHRNTLNVDAFFPNGIVVDLGTIQRVDAE